jgi:hypothetical protein
MRYYCYNDYKTDPSVDSYVEVKSEEDIRREYWPYWYKKMCEKYEQSYVDENFNFEDCLTDWIVVNWAWESSDEKS